MKLDQVIKIDLSFNGQKKIFFIEKSSFLIGRGETCDLKIEDKNISREHLRITLDDSRGLLIEDLKSTHGTYIDAKKLTPEIPTPIAEKNQISFSNCTATLKIALVNVKPHVRSEVSQMEKTVEENRVSIEIKGYDKNESDLKIDFKKVGLDLDKILSPQEIAHAVIKEAEFIKHSLIKNAEVQQQKILNDLHIKAQEISQKSYSEYKSKIDLIIESTRLQLSEMRSNSDNYVNQKKKDAQLEIENAWIEHKIALEVERKSTIEKLEIEYKNKFALEKEKLKVEALVQQKKLLDDAEAENIKNYKLFKIKVESEQTEHESKIHILNEQILKCEERLESLRKQIELNKVACDEVENKFHHISREIITTEYAIELNKKTNDDLLKQNQDLQKSMDKLVHDKNTEITEKTIALQKQLEIFENQKIEAIDLKNEALKNYHELKSKFNQLSEKKNSLEEQTNDLEKMAQQQMLKNKLEIENEFKILKEKEIEKFEQYKNQEVNEFKKIRQQHAQSIKKISLDLSEEISTKLEILLKQSNTSSFDFEKSVELINSVIQVKAGEESGQNSSHTDQIALWKSRNTKEKHKNISVGFVIAIAVYFLGNLTYKQFTRDSRVEDLRQIASEREQKEIQNRYVPVKTNTYYGDYVQSTIYTKNFSDVYLNEKNHFEWVKYATYYFVNKWKVSEEDTVKVLSNSKSLVQFIDRSIPELKKDRLKQNLEKLQEMEKESILSNSRILGSQVRYEAMKKIEKEFFLKKIQELQNKR